MAPLPQNNTGRAWIDYVTGIGGTSQVHSVMCRFTGASGSDGDAALDALASVLAAPGEGAYMDGWQATGARIAAPGSDFSLPASLPFILTAFVGEGQASPTYQDQARETRFVGRGLTTGRRVSVSVYGLRASLFTSADFRLPAGGGDEISLMRAAINSAGVGLFVSIGNDETYWATYANWQYNSHWEGELRG